jgi:hypothetical protein
MAQKTEAKIQNRDRKGPHCAPQTVPALHSFVRSLTVEDPEIHASWPRSLALLFCPLPKAPRLGHPERPPSCYMISTPEGRSTAASTETSVTSARSAFRGFACQDRILRSSVIFPAFFSRVSVVEPDFSTNPTSLVVDPRIQPRIAWRHYGLPSQARQRRGSGYSSATAPFVPREPRQHRRHELCVPI